MKNEPPVESELGFEQVSQFERADRICDAYEQAWLKGERPQLEDFLSQVPATQRDNLRRELNLIQGDYQKRPQEAEGTPAPAETVLLDRSPTSLSGSDLPARIDRYRIERLLGQGGFGCVYLAHDDQLQRLVAVKVPHTKLVSSDENSQVYLSEARTVANLDHPNVVPVYDVGATTNCPCYIVSKYVEGSDLATKIKKDLPTRREAIELVATVAEALGYAHSQGVVHRDVKPGNILIGLDGRPYVVDFGLALRKENIGTGPKYLGTPAYMSPEQADGEGHRVDARSDIFSLGVVLYELLTGKRPFQGDTEAELLDQVTACNPISLRRHDEHLPEELERICHRAMARQIDERFTSAREFATALRQLLTVAEPAEQAKQIKRRSNAPRRPRFRKRMLCGAAFSAIAGTILIGLGSRGSIFDHTVIQQQANETGAPQAVDREVAGGRESAVIVTTDEQPIARNGEELTIRGGPVEELTLRSSKYREPAIRHGQPKNQERATITRDRQTTLRMSRESDQAATEPNAAHFVRSDHPEGSAGTSPNAPTLKKILVGHADKIYSIVYSPDGRLLASAGLGEVLVWDMQSESLAYVLPGQKEVRFSAITFSPEGRFLLTAPFCAPAPISIWEASTGKSVGVIEGHVQGLYDLSFSPDGLTLVSGGHESFVRIWDFPGRRKLRDIPVDSRWVRSAIFSKDGQLAFGQDKVYLADAGGNILRTIDKHAGPLCFSPDGRRLAGTTWQQGLVTVWEVDNGKEIASWRAHDRTAEGLTFSRDGNVLATAGGDARVRLWAWDSQRKLAELSHERDVAWVAFSPDGFTLATAAADGLIRLWDVAEILAKQR